MLLYSASGRVAYNTRSGVRPDSLCSFIWPSGGSLCFYILPLGASATGRRAARQAPLQPRPGEADVYTRIYIYIYIYIFVYRERERERERDMHKERERGRERERYIICMYTCNCNELHNVLHNIDV